jgi:putative ABC transport system permease protein
MAAPLTRKLLRDVWQAKAQTVAIVMVLAAGIAMFVAYLSAFASLELTRDRYYHEARFAQVFATLDRAPEALRDRLQAVPGVAAVETRVVATAALDLPHLVEPASARLVSMRVPPSAMLNALHLRRGRYPIAGGHDEVVVNEAFAIANQLSPGDTVAALVNGRRRMLRVVGVALSPEYVYVLRPGEIIPDDRRSGVFWLDRTALAAAFDLTGSFNDVVLTLTPGAREPAVIDAIDRILRPYGGRGAIGRRLQTSDWAVTNELTQLKGFGLFIPLVFLTVAAFLLNVVLMRTVGLQRLQIAALKALGYSGAAIGAHYAWWAVVIGSAGAVLGIGGGWWLGHAMMALYNDFFRFPALTHHVSAGVLAAAVSISIGAALAGALAAVRGAVILPPAVAMVPAAPPRYRRSVIERIGPGLLLGPIGRMIGRNLERQPVRSATSIVGVASATALLVLGLFFLDATGAPRAAAAAWRPGRRARTRPADAHPSRAPCPPGGDQRRTRDGATAAGRHRRWHPGRVAAQGTGAVTSAGRCAGCTRRRQRRRRTAGRPPIGSLGAGRRADRRLRRLGRLHAAGGAPGAGRRSRNDLRRPSAHR